MDDKYSSWNEILFGVPQGLLLKNISKQAHFRHFSR